MDDGMVDRWGAAARDAAVWKEGEPIGRVLEALAGAVALEVLGELGRVPSAVRDELRKIGQRALLHVGAEKTRREASEEDEDALPIAVELARDGLRALAGRAPEPVEAGSPPSPRDVARLLGGRIDWLEAAAIARRVRSSEPARRELAWALRMRHPADEPRVRLAAADGVAMRDPGEGRAIATALDPETGAIVAEAYAFAGGAVAVYSESGEPLRVEGEGVRTEVMQAGYWSGTAGTQIEGVLWVGDRSIEIRWRS
jgi:hypothetical protein